MHDLPSLRAVHLALSLLRGSFSSTLDSWFAAHDSCPACAVHQPPAPCAPQFALYNAVRERAHTFRDGPDAFIDLSRE